MFCPKCGRELPDHSQFCSGCGAKTAPAAAPVQQATNAAKPKKKKANFLVISIVLLVCYLIGSGIGNSMAESYVGNGDSGNADSGNQTSQNTISPDSQDTVSDSGAYDKVFSDRGIIFAPEVFFGLDYAAYVYVDGDGIITHEQYGYEDDIVTEYVVSVYYPVESMDVEALDEYIRSKYESLGLSFVKLRTNMGSSYYSYTISISGLNYLINIQMAEDADLISMGAENVLWSMSATEESLLARGYIKK